MSDDWRIRFPVLAEQERLHRQGVAFRDLVADGAPMMDPYRPKTRNAGFADRVKHPAGLDADEAEFVAAKRLAGFTDAAIAKMLGCSIERVTGGQIEPAYIQPTLADLEAAHEARRQRHRADRLNTTWRSPAERRRHQRGQQG